MESNELVQSLEKSIFDDLSSIAADAAEIGLDAILEDGFLKDVPFVSTVIGLYKIGATIKERHYIKKLYSFILEFSRGVASDEARKKLRARIQNDPQKRKQELEYILVLIDRYLSSDKSEMLAKLYCAYLDDRIDWQEFSMYAEVIDRLFPKDLEFLKLPPYYFEMYGHHGSESILRLVSLGLMVEDPLDVPLSNNISSQKRCQKRKYSRTNFGSQLIRILQ